MKISLLVFSILVPAAPARALDRSPFGPGLDLASVRQTAAELTVPEPSQPATAPGQAGPAPLKEWTVMAFINGSNDRADLYSENLRAMSTVGTTASVNVVAEVGLRMQSRSLVQRMLVLPGDGSEINSQVYKTWLNRDMGDWRNAAEFFKWAKAAFPARRYMMIIQNHGGGFTDETYVPASQAKGISYDYVSKNYIKIPELPLLLSEAGGADIFIMNACLMQQAEVAYEIGRNAGVILASEETDSSLYYQYGERLQYLNANPQASTERTAAAFVALRRKLMQPGNSFYSEVLHSTITINRGYANTLSAVRPSEVAGLPAALDKWTGAVMAANETEAVKFAVATAPRFGVQNSADQPFSKFTDLGDFVGRVMSLSNDAAVRDAGSELLELLAKRVVLANSAMNVNSAGADYSRVAKGLAIKMVPLSPVNPAVMAPGMSIIEDTKYADLRLSRDSQWDEFLRWAGNIFYSRR